MEKKINNNFIGIFILLVVVLSMLFAASWSLGESKWLISLLEPDKVGTVDYSVPYVPQILLFIESIMFLSVVLWLYKQNIRTLEQKNVIERLGQVDALTGLLNRSKYQEFLLQGHASTHDSLGCIYIDANGLHELNNTQGHSAGDVMLQVIAQKIAKFFGIENSYRIGGDEFVVFYADGRVEDLEQQIAELKQSLKKEDYHISVGCAWYPKPYEIDQMINEAERKMYEEKGNYYREHGGAVSSRSVDWRLQEILREKRDTDSFLAIIASYFMGVYMVNLKTDEARIIYRPAYFNIMLQNTNNKFRPALETYVTNLVQEEDRAGFDQMLDYNKLQDFFEATNTMEYRYEKLDGDKLIMRICKAEGYCKENPETCWIFESINDKNSMLKLH